MIIATVMVWAVVAYLIVLYWRLAPRGVVARALWAAATLGWLVWAVEISRVLWR